MPSLSFVGIDGQIERVMMNMMMMEMENDNHNDGDDDKNDVPKS